MAQFRSLAASVLYNAETFMGKGAKGGGVNFLPSLQKILITYKPFCF
jgi:hypothetical protein